MMFIGMRIFGVLILVMLIKVGSFLRVLVI